MRPEIGHLAVGLISWAFNSNESGQLLQRVVLVAIAPFVFAFVNWQVALPAVIRFGLADNNIVLGKFAGYYAIPELCCHLCEYYHDLVGLSLIHI